MEEQDATEHHTSVTEEILQIIEDFADYIDVFLFEILTFLAVFNAMMNLGHDILSLCGFDGWKMAFPSTVSFVLSLSLFLFGTKKRRKKRRGKKSSESADMEESTSGGLDLDMLGDVTNVCGDMSNAIDKVNNPTLEAEELSSVVIDMGSEPSDDETSDNQSHENVTESTSYFRSAIACFVNMIRKCQRFKKGNETPKEAPTSGLDHGGEGMETMALTKDAVPVEGINEKELPVNKVGKKLKERAHGVESVIQESKAMIPLGNAISGHGLCEETEFISGYVKKKGAEGGKALGRKTSGVLKHSKEKMLDGSKKVSLELQSGSEYLTSAIDVGEKKSVSFDDLSLSEDEGDKDDAVDEVDEPRKGKKRITHKVIRGASYKAKKFYAKRKKGIKKVRRKRPKSLLQIFRRVGRLILRVVFRRPPDNNQAEEVPEEAITPRKIPRMVVSFFLRIYQNCKMKRKNELPEMMTLSSVRILKVPGNAPTESKYVVCNVEYSWFESRSEADLTTLIVKTEEDEVNTEMDVTVGDKDHETVSPVCSVAEKPLKKDVHKLKRKLGISMFVDSNQNINNKYSVLQNDENEKCNDDQTDDHLQSTVSRNDAGNVGEEVQHEEEEMEGQTDGRNTKSTADNNYISLAIQDLESSVVIHPFPKPTCKETKTGCEERPQLQDGHSFTKITTLQKSNHFSKPTCEETKNICQERPHSEKEQSFSTNTALHVLRSFPHQTFKRNSEEQLHLEGEKSFSKDITLQENIPLPTPYPTFAERKLNICEGRSHLQEEQSFPENTTLQECTSTDLEQSKRHSVDDLMLGLSDTPSILNNTWTSCTSLEILDASYDYSF